MKKRIAIIATAVLIVALLVVGSTLAFFTDKGEVNNVITMGNVKITLTEPQFEKLTNNTYTVSDATPGKVYDKDPTITNVGDNDAYIRCKVTVKGLEKAKIDELLNNITFNKDFVKFGEYYYCQSVLPKKPLTGVSEVKLFNKVTIPKDWDNSIVGKEYSICITAEAIQKDNFYPTRDSNQNIIAWQYSDGKDVPFSDTSSTEIR